MPIHGYFHVALMFGGDLIAAEMHGRLLQSGLYDLSDLIDVIILGPRAEVDRLVGYIFNHYPKYRVRHHSENLQEFEWPTLKAIEQDAKTEHGLLWYMHTKGASNCRPDVSVYIQHNIRAWRGVMCHGMMQEHERALALLRSGQASAVGPLYVSPDRISNSHHFSGNFWWATTTHILGLPPIAPPLTNGRNMAEEWIGMGSGRLVGLSECAVFDLYDFTSKYAPQGPLHGMPGAL